MSALRNFTFTTFCVFLVVKGLSSAPVNVPLTSVSNLLIQTALSSLNESSPNHHTYQNGELISAQKLVETPLTIYRLTFNLDPTCDEKSVCPKEACTLEVKQHEGGAVSVNRDSVQCLYLHPQSQPQVPNHDQELIDSLEKQIGDNIKLDHEVQTSADHNDRPFIAVPANKSPYCPGCPYDLNPRNLPGVSAFVDQIVQSMDDSLAGDFKHTAITILRISRSVPPNANVVRYEFLLLIAETSCLKTSLVERTECSLQSGTPIKRCLVTLEEKPWQENSRVITKNNCTGTNLENELNSSVGTNFSPENTPSGNNNSPSSVSNQEGNEDSKTEFYDQVAQEGKFSTYETMPNQYFESPTLNLTVEGEDGNIKRVVIEEPAKKVVLDKDDVQEKKEGFADRMKEFDSFLKDFDVLVRDMKPIKDERIPVVEDVIKPVKIESGSQSEDENGKGCSKKRIESIRVKRDLGNADLVVVHDELLAKKLARKAIAILDDIDSDSMKRIVLKVLEAKKENEKTSQVNYYLKLKVATTTCSEGELDFAEERRCLEDAINPVRICKIQLSTSEENPLLSPKIIESACIDFSEEVKTRRRREILVGGSTKKDINDPKIQKYAQLGLQEYAKNLDSSYEPLIANITDAKVQVVSGILYKIKVQFGNSNCRKGETENCQLQSDGELKECLIKAWSQPWLDNDNPKVTVDCESDESKGSDNLNPRRPDPNVVVDRKKRSLPGGITPMNVSDSDIQNYAKLGLKQYSQGLQSSNEPVIARIVEASSQVVSGMLYRIKVQFGNSDCQKGQTENCQLQSDSELKECDIEAWSQPWLDKDEPKITVTCGSERSKRSTDAYQKEMDKTQDDLERMFDMPIDIDDQVKKDAQDGLKKYAETSKSPYEPLIAKITQATNNDDAGVNKVFVNIGDSNCKKGQKKNCKLQSGKKLKKCVIRITNDQRGRIVETICEQSKKSEKKSEGTTPMDVKDPDTEEFANLGLEKYSQIFKSSHEPIISRIIKASSFQHDDETHYNFQVQIGDSDCLKGKYENCKLQSHSKLRECALKIVRAPWVFDGPSKVTVNCKPEKKSPEKSEQKSNEVKSRPRREALLGGTTPMDVNDPDIQNYAKLGLQQYSQGLQSSNEPVIASIVEASSQVVSGMLYRIKVQFGNSDCPKGETEYCQLQSDSELTECEVKAWSRPWINKGEPQITVKCGSERRKRSLDADEKELAKGQDWIERTFDETTDIDDEVKKNAQLGLKKYAETSKSPYEPLIAKITQATANDDAGVKKVYVNIGDSNCKKGQKHNCKLQSGTKLKKCVIRISDDQTGERVEAICEHSKKSEKKSEGTTPMDVNDSDTREFADYGLKKYSQIFKSSHEPIIARIIKASSFQHDGETHYKFQVQVGDSDCLKGKYENCKLQSHSKLRECALEIVRAPWVFGGPSKVTVNCKPENKSPEKSEQKSDEVKSRPRREALLGGTAPMDVSSPDIQNYAKLGLQKYSQGLQTANEPVIARIVEASSQVVSGMLYRIKVQFGNSDCPKGQTENCQLQSDSELEECDIEAWSQPWLDKDEPKITVTCGSERSKRSTDADEKESAKEQDWIERTFDGPIDIDDEVKKNAQLGLKKYAETSESPYEPLIAKITQATANDDAGVKKVYVNIGDSNCKKGQKHNCKLQSGTKLKKCVIRISDDQTGERVEAICEHSKKSEKKSEGTTPMDVKDPDTEEFANYGLEKYSQIFKSSHEPIIAKIVKASSSKHDGETHYKFQVQIGDSSCLKGDNINCKLQPHSKLRECTLDLVMAPWVYNEPLKAEVNCKPPKKSPEKSEQKSSEVKSRPRREALLGGTTPMDVNNPDIQNYAKLGLQQYSQGLQSANEPVIARIDEASSQVVSGMLYRIKVQFGNSDCPKGQTEYCQLQSDSELTECEVKAWSRPWINEGEPKITVNCGSERRKRSTDADTDEYDFEKMFDMPIDIDDQVKKDAQDGLKKYAKTSESPYEPLIAKITEATDNDDAGVKKIYVSIGDSNCKKGQKHNCKLQSGTKLKRCVIRIPYDQKVETICEHSKKSEKKSEATTPEDVNDPDTQSYANYGLEKYSQIFKSSYEPIIAKIIKASSSKHDGEAHFKFQVQIGDSYCLKGKYGNYKLQSHSKLRECMLEIVMAPWVSKNTSKVTVNCKPPKKSPEKSEQKSDEVKSRPRREALLGGTTPMDVNDPDIQNYAKLGLQQYSQGLQSSNEPVIASIVEASSQVVSGMLYRIKVQFGNSNCPKGQTEYCQLQSDSELEECEVKAWSRPWINEGEPKITVNCGSERRKRSTDADTDEYDFEKMFDMPIDIDDQVKKDAQDGLKKYAKTNESPYEPLIAKITEATDNDDACVKKIYVSIGDSNCKKGQKHNCKLQSGTKLKRCVIRIPYDQKVETICEPSKKSEKKSEATTPEDVNDPDTQSYADYGLEKYSQIFKSSYVPIIAKIIKASSSKHDGEAHFKFQVQIGDSDCLKGKYGNCKLQSHSKLRECMLEIVMAPWVSKKTSKVTVNCKPEKKSPEKSEQKSNEVKSRPRREALLGGTTPMDVNDPDIQNYAKLGLQQYSQGLQSSNEPVIASIVEASSQVVSGMLYRIKVQFGNSDCPKGQREYCQLQSGSELTDCEVKAWSRPWINKGEPQITVTCGSERRKRSTDADKKEMDKTQDYLERKFDSPNMIDDQVKKDAQRGLKKYAETSESPYEPLIAKITQATDNADAEVTKVYVNIGDSNCKKGQKQNCKLQSGTKLKRCVIRITYDQRVETICEQSKKSEKKFEATTPMDVNDPDTQDFADYGLKKYSQIFKSSYEPIIAKIIKASSSKHDGETHYKFQVQIGDSDCLKGKHDSYKLQPHSKLRECVLEIVTAPWVYNEPLKAEVNCKPPKKSPEKSEQKSDEVKSRPRREALLGGTTPMDVNDPDIQNYAKLGLQQYSQGLQSSNEPVIASIVEASSQVVSGMLYRIKVQFGNSNCPKGQTEYCQLQSDSELTECEVKAWSRPWINKGEPQITVTCGSERRKRSTDAEKDEELFEKMYDSEVEIDDEIKKDAQLGLKIYAKTSESPYEPLIAKITHATTNTDAMLEKITVKFGDSNCKKGQTQHCKLQPDTKLKECVIRISDAPYGNAKDEKVTVVCKHSKKSSKSAESKSKDVKSRRRREALLGGTTQIDVNDSDIQNYAKLGLKQYSQGLQSSNEPVIARIVEASSQVVSGMLYRIKVQFGNSDCPKGRTENCQLQSDSELKECDIEAWSQPWLDKGEPQIKVTCGSDRTKRTLRGQNYSQKMLQQAEEMKEEGNTDQSDKVNLQGENYSQKMLRQAEEIKADRMKDLISEGRSLRGQNYNQKMLKQAGEIKDETLEAEQLFRDFVEEFQKVYPNDEEKQKRLGIFRENLKKIEELRRYEEGTGEYGVTNFTDLTTEEFRSNYLGLRPDLKSENEIPFPMAEIPDVSLPTEFDWRKKNAVTGVKDQGSCGSCWAFSVTGNIEGQYAIKHGELLSFSEQELVDCDKLDEGCKGGLPDSAYRAIEKLGGLETESDYPYDAEDETCHFSKSKIKVKVVSAVNITSNETEMAQWLVQNGPISIGINANAMQFYIGGISHPPKFLCDPKNLDHGVLIVGFGVHTYPIFKKTLPFWIVKNSWGPRWGERGYYRVYRGGSTCGVNQMASSAIVA